jgi:hypothetical protein
LIAASVCERLWVSAPSTIMTGVHILSVPMLDARRTGLAQGAATLLSRHAEHPRPATSDTTKGSQAHRPTASKRVSSPPGRDHPTASDVTDPTESKQQASRQH